MEENSELKPCPFCGGKVEIIDDVMHCYHCCTHNNEENLDGIIPEAWQDRPIEDELQAKINELEGAVTARQQRVKELDEQIQDLQTLLQGIWDLKISKRWQARALKRAYEKWLYSRQGQTIKQLKLEIFRLRTINMQQQSALDESAKLTEEMGVLLQTKLEQLESEDARSND